MTQRIWKEHTEFKQDTKQAFVSKCVNKDIKLGRQYSKAVKCDSLGDCLMRSKCNTKKLYTYTFHCYNFFIWNLFATGNYIYMPYALFEVCAKLFYIFVLFMLTITEFFCVAFEFTIDFGILRCIFATALVIFVFRLMHWGDKTYIHVCMHICAQNDYFSTEINKIWQNIHV